MPRRPRLHVPGGFFHVTLRGNHRREIFHEDSDRDLLEGLLHDSLRRDGCSVHAYCWMSNHVHLAVRAGDRPLGQFIQHFAGRYARSVQCRVPTTGHLFERRYHAIFADSDTHLMALIRYIHMNPVRAGIVTDPVEYRWSSHRAYLGLTQMDWLSTEFGLGLFGCDPARARTAYRHFMTTTPDPAVDAYIRDGTTTSDHPAPGTPLPSAPPATENRSERLEALIAATASTLGVSAADLATPSRARRLSMARALIAQQALHTRLATLSEIAARFHRAPATLWAGIRRYGINARGLFR